MSINIDLETLAQITQEARQCFLTEDAPEYLEMLEEGVKQGLESANLTLMMRAAHSLKGGGGLAELSGIRELAHQMEEVLEGFNNKTIPRSPEAWSAIERSVTELAFLLSQAEVDQNLSASPDLLQALASFSPSSSGTNLQSFSDEAGQNKLLTSLLNNDLEESLIKIEQLDKNSPVAEIKQSLNEFYEECLFIGDTLELTWLTDIVEGLQKAVKNLEVAEALDLTKEAIESLRTEREKYLQQHDPSSEGELTAKPEINKLAETLLNNDLEESLIKIEQLDKNAPVAEITEILNEFYEECLFIGDTLELTWLTDIVEGLQEATKNLEVSAALDLTKEAIESLRTEREKYLQQHDPSSEGELTAKPEINKLAENLLNNDLEESLIKIEQLDKNAPVAEITEILNEFYEECLFIGDTLELAWLTDIVEGLQEATKNLEVSAALDLTKEAIESLYAEKEKYLQQAASASALEIEAELKPEINKLAENLLNNDLEESLIKIERLDKKTPEGKITESLNEFYEECLFIGDTLELAWLTDIIEGLQEAVKGLEVSAALDLAKEAIEFVRTEKEKYLQQYSLSSKIELPAKPEIDKLAETLLNNDLEESLIKIEQLDKNAPEAEITESLNEFYEECLFIGDTLELSWLTEIVESLQEVTKNLEISAALGLTKERIVSLRAEKAKYLQQFLSSTEVAGQIEQEINSEIENQTAAKSDRITETLLNDLEKSFTKIENISLDTTETEIKQHLENFCDECLFIGQTLQLSWLVENIESFQTRLAKSSSRESLVLAKEAIDFLRNKRNGDLAKDSVSETITTTPALPAEKEVPPAIKTVKAQEDTRVTRDNLTSSSSYLRVPLKQLESMGNNVGELILIQERLRLQQQLLQQANIRIRQLSRRFEPIREQVQATYDWLAINPQKINPLIAINNDADREGKDNNNHSSGLSSPQFEELELDRFTGLHTSLQEFQELMLRIQETRVDLELVDRELSEDLDLVGKNLNSLYNNITKSRLVPFAVLAKRFVPQIKRLDRLFEDKSVKLTIAGENTLADRLLLEELQTPLTHLLNNAVDHGIETIKERLANDKQKTAKITMEAVVKNNQLTIIVSDDGKGIDLERVYQRAIERGLCPQSKSMQQLSKEQIIDFIFQPGFSTAQQVSQISGRGMGLDIVRDQIRRLQGNLKVETETGVGTKFRLKFPLDLSLVSLLTVRYQEQILAFPSSDILETLPTSELKIIEQEAATVIWHQKEIPLIHLCQLLPYSRVEMQETHSKIALILASSLGQIAVTVDSLLSEGELILKPFDKTIATPTYLAGCTILGTGQVVPVILPQALEQPLPQIVSPPKQETAKDPNQTPTILVAEDSVGTRRYLERLLTQVGFKVIVCRDGQEALDKLPQLEGQINLIISDVEMPRLNGFELLYWLRNNPAWAKVPVVMATSRTADRYQDQAKELGADGYLGKPVQPQELFSTLETLLAFDPS